MRDFDQILRDHGMSWGDLMPCERCGHIKRDHGPRGVAAPCRGFTLEGDPAPGSWEERSTTAWVQVHREHPDGERLQLRTDLWHRAMRGHLRVVSGGPGRVILGALTGVWSGLLWLVTRPWSR